MRFRFTHSAIVLVVSVLLTGIAFAQKVLIEYDNSIDISAYGEYDCREHPFLKTHPKSKQFTVGAQLVQSDTNQILMKRGYGPLTQIQGTGSPGGPPVPKRLTAEPSRCGWRPPAK